MALAQPWLLYSHSQNGWWTGEEFNADPDLAKEYTSRNNVILDIENVVVAGGNYEAIQTIKKPYPATSVAKKM